MSYRTFKHLIGETSLERKCRFIFGAGILILITGSFYWYGRKSEAMVYDKNKETCRLLANRILLRHHWVKLESLKDFRENIVELDAAFGELFPGTVNLYQSRFIRPNDPDLLPGNEFEYKALASFLKGDSIEATQIVSDEPPSGEAKYQYLLAVRLKESCISCHPTLKYNRKPAKV